jgi:hypothetical protein
LRPQNIVELKAESTLNEIGKKTNYEVAGGAYMFNGKNDGGRMRLGLACRQK